MPKTTEKLGLIQPEGHEKYDVEVQNENMAKIEAALIKCMESENTDTDLSAEEALTAAIQYIDEQIKKLVGTAPEALDTIHELAGAMAENSDLIEALNNAIGNSAKKEELESHVGDNTVHVTSAEREAWNDSNSKKHSHDNQAILETITQQLITAWNEAVEHITDGTRHVTSNDKELWNTVSDKADADSVATKLSQLENDKNYVTQAEMEEYAQPKGDSTSQDHTHANKGVLDAITQEQLDKLDGIASGANKTIVDSALSSTSTNPVQNKVVNTALADKYSSSASRTANTVLAAPNGSNGTASFRKLVSNDLPTVPISKGGTGSTTAAGALKNLGITATAEELNKIKTAVFFVKD